jgi:hypothetical protein
MELLLRYTRGESVDALDAATKRTALGAVVLATDESTAALATTLLLEAGADQHRVPAWSSSTLADGRVDGLRGLCPLALAAKAGRIPALRIMLGLGQEAGRRTVHGQEAGSAIAARSHLEPMGGELLEAVTSDKEAADASAAASAGASGSGEAVASLGQRDPTDIAVDTDTGLGRWPTDGSVMLPWTTKPRLQEKAAAVASLGSADPVGQSGQAELSQAETVSLTRAACAAVLAGHWGALASIASVSPAVLDVSVSGVKLSEVMVIGPGRLCTLSGAAFATGGVAAAAAAAQDKAEGSCVVSAKLLALLASDKNIGAARSGEVAPLWWLRADLAARLDPHDADVISDSLAALRNVLVLREQPESVSVVESALSELKPDAAPTDESQMRIECDALALVLRLASRGVQCASGLDGVLRALRSPPTVPWRAGGRKLHRGTRTTSVCFMLQGLPPPLGLAPTTAAPTEQTHQHMQTLQTHVQRASSAATDSDAAVIVPGCGFVLPDDSIVVRGAAATE